MEIITIQYFLSLAEHLNFSQAAEENNISQSSFSKAIKRLEGDLGVQLIDRSRHPIALTPAGKCFHDRMLELKPQYQQAMEELAAFAKGDTIRLFICPRSFQYKMAIEEFLQQEKDIRVRMEETSDISEVTQALQSGKYDFVISPRPFDLPEDVRATVLYDDALYLLAEASSPLAARSSVSLKELDGQVVFGASYTRLLTCELARRFGFSPRIPPSPEGREMRRQEAIHRISMNLGIGIYSSRDLRPYRNVNMRCIPIREVPDFPVVLLERSGEKGSQAKHRFRKWITENLVHFVPERLDVEKFNRKTYGQ